MTWQDLVSFAGEVGFATPRLVSSTTMEAGCEAVATPLKEGRFRQKPVLIFCYLVSTLAEFLSKALSIDSARVETFGP